MFFIYNITNPDYAASWLMVIVCLPESAPERGIVEIREVRIGLTTAAKVIVLYTNGIILCSKC